MTIASIDTARLNRTDVADYFQTADRRIVSGFRTALELLGLPIPDYVTRKPAGRPSLKSLMERVDADTGTIRTYNDEKRKIGVFAPRSAS